MADRLPSNDAVSVRETGGVPAAGGAVQAYDGREVAPAAATEDYLLWVSETDRTDPKPDTRASGRSFGVPGVVRMYFLEPDGSPRTAQSVLTNPAYATTSGWVGGADPRREGLVMGGTS